MKAFRKLEETTAGLALGAMVLLPLLEIPLRKLGTGIPAAISVERHLTLWVAFLGAALAAREGRLLSLATGQLLPEGTTNAGGPSCDNCYLTREDIHIFYSYRWLSLDFRHPQRKVLPKKKANLSPG